MEGINGQDPERIRLREVRENQAAWKKWGPYLSERQRGTMPVNAMDIRVFWVQDFNYVWVGALAALAAFFGVRNFGLQTLYRPLLYLDAVIQGGNYVLED